MNIQFADGTSFEAVGGECQIGIIESADIDGNQLFEPGDMSFDVEFEAIPGDITALLGTRPEIRVNGELIGWMMDITKVTPNSVSGEFWPVERGAPPV